MTPRALLIGVLASGTVLAGVIIGALAIGIEHPKATIAAKAAVGSCAPYAGLPADQGDTAGMAFIPGDSFTWARHATSRRSVSPTSCAWTASGSTATR
jgi:hypothetical protein